MENLKKTLVVEFKKEIKIAVCKLFLNGDERYWSFYEEFSTVYLQMQNYNCRIIVPDKALFNETLNVSLSWELEEADIENIPFLKIKIKKINALPK